MFYGEHVNNTSCLMSLAKILSFTISLRWRETVISLQMHLTVVLASSQRSLMLLDYNSVCSLLTFRNIMRSNLKAIPVDWCLHEFQ